MQPPSALSQEWLLQASRPKGFPNAAHLAATKMIVERLGVITKRGKIAKDGLRDGRLIASIVKQGIKNFGASFAPLVLDKGMKVVHRIQDYIDRADKSHGLVWLRRHPPAAADQRRCRHLAPLREAEAHTALLAAPNLRLRRDRNSRPTDPVGRRPGPRPLRWMPIARRGRRQRLPSDA